MDDLSLTGFDIAVLLILLFSTLLAFFRGFVREVLSLAGWIGAAIVTAVLYEPVAEMLEPSIGNETASKLAAVIGVYIISLIIFSIVSSIVVKFVKSSGELGSLDSSLGLVFGVLRGAFIISLGYLVLSMVIDEASPPDWMRGSITRPYARQGAEALANIAPGYLEDVSSLTERAVQEGKSAAQSAADDATRGLSDGVSNATDDAIDEMRSIRLPGRD